MNIFSLARCVFSFLLMFLSFEYADYWITNILTKYARNVKLNIALPENRFLIAFVYSDFPLWAESAHDPLTNILAKRYLNFYPTTTIQAYIQYKLISFESFIFIVCNWDQNHSKWFDKVGYVYIYDLSDAIDDVTMTTFTT